MIRSAASTALLAALTFLIGAGCDPGGLTPDAGLLADGEPPGDLGPPTGDRGPGDPDLDDGVGDPDEVNPLLNSIFPNRAPLGGALSVRLVGRDFADGMAVRIGTLDCEDVAVENQNRMTCTVPPSAVADSFDVSVTWPDGARDTLPRGFTYFEPVTIAEILPPVGPALGGAPITILGTGFIEATEVRIGGIRADVAEVIPSDRLPDRLEVIIPPGEPGTVDVVVRNLNGSATAEDGFTWYEELFVDDIDPPWGLTDGDTEVRLAGIGLLDDSAVTFGRGQAQNVASELDRQRLRVITPPAGLPGVVDVTVRNSNGVWQGEGAFLYVRSSDGPFVVDGIAPDRVPASGGRDVFIGGNGFDDATRVLLGDAGGETPIACALERPQLLRCTPPVRPAGVVDVIVEGAERVVLEDGLTFYQAIEIFDLTPDRGGVAGGTLVQLVGRGLHPDMTVEFDRSEAEVVSVAVDGESALIRTPAGRRGRVAVRAETADDDTLLPQAYEYFDPAIGVGGIGGDSIANAVNVTVLDSRSGFPVAGARVLVTGMSADERWEGVANDLGQVVIADEALTLPVSVTAAAHEYSTTTYDRVTAENVTLLLNSLVPPEQGPGDPPPPIEPVTLRGTAFGIDELEKPDGSGEMLIVFVETSHTSFGNRLGSPPPAPNGILVEDGPFEIVVRPGELAIVATAGYVPIAAKEAYDRGETGYWTLRDALVPIAMGLRRFIGAAPGDTIEDLEVHLDRPLRMTVPAVIDNPPGAVRGAPDRFTIRPVLSLGAEGWFDFRYEQSAGEPRMRFRAMPDLSAWPDLDVTMFWDAEATQTDPTQPYNYAVAEAEVRDMRNGVVISPMVGTTRFTDPVDGGVLSPSRWVEFQVHPGYDRPDAPSEPADFHLVRVTRDGQIIWSQVVPGAVRRFQFPRLPPPEPGDVYADLEGGLLQMSILSVLVSGEFQFDDFTYNDFGRMLSYSFSYVAFSP